MGAVHSDLKSNIVQASGTTIPQDDTEFWQTVRSTTTTHALLMLTLQISSGRGRRL